MNVVRYGVDEIVYNKNTALTVGTFDGVHCGHQGIISAMKDVAAKNKERTVVVTFDPHPQIVLARANKEPLRLLSGIEERCERLAECGIELVVVIPFTLEFARTPAEEFVRQVIVETIGVQHFFIGHDHSFGKDRGGNEELLQQLGKDLGFSVISVPPLVCDGRVVSSTKVRLALRQGNINEARDMLGRRFAIRGTVQHGDGRGQTLGIPTANIKPVEQFALLPANGVYVVSSVIDGVQQFGMANIGVRPTFTTDATPSLEVHYLNVSADLYGKVLDVEFHQSLRNEKKFASAEEFLNQLELDKKQTQNYQQLFHERSSS